MSEFKRVLYPKKENYVEKIAQIKSKNPKDIVNSLKDYYEIPWDFDSKLQKSEEEYPSLGVCTSIYLGLNFCLDSNKKREEIYKTDILNIMLNQRSTPIKDIMVNTVNKEEKYTSQEVEAILQKHGLASEVDIIKGSIYKIKRYFMENNKIKDIRGGSWIVNYLNNEYVEMFLEDTEKNGLIKECLIYSGGGNILIMAPKGKGKEVCEELESKFEEIGLTIMCAFTYLETSVYNLLYRYRDVRQVLDRKLQKYSKGKIHNLNPKQINVKSIKRKNGGLIELKMKTKMGGNCNLCHVRDGAYEIAKIEGESGCPSCSMKHQIGEEIKEEYFDEYRKTIEPLVTTLSNKENRLLEPKIAQTIDQIQDKNGMIAVIYGDGNNMGSAVSEISNIYEMMYFSYKTDAITKQSVYESVFEVLEEKDYFEIIAVGGDDIFIIVPADCAPLIGEKIISKFDTAFEKQITMSVGICLGKHTTPVAALFNIAHDNLDKAKVITRVNDKNKTNGNKIKEGSIDISEIRGGQTVLNDEAYQGLFPLSYTEFAEALKQIDEMKDSKMRLYDYDYASEIMPKEEFNLYFEYKEAQAQRNKHKDKGVREYLKFIVNKETTANIYLQNYKPWSDLLLLMKYRRKQLCKK